MAKKKETISIELAKLFVDYLYFVQIHQLLEKDRKCWDDPNFGTWKCCNSHRHLSETLMKLKKRAKKINSIKMPVDCVIFSPNWWRENGFIFPASHIIID